MPPTPRSRLTLLDAMILLGATGLGLWMSRSYFQYIPGDPFPVAQWVPPPTAHPSPVVSTVTPTPTADRPTPAPILSVDPFPARPSDADRSLHATQRPLLVLVPMLPPLASWSICLALLALAKERASPRRAMGRPEAWVGLATAAVLFVRLAGWAAGCALADRLGRRRPEVSDLLARPADALWSAWLHPYPFAAPTEIGWSVAIAWLSLALNRRWRRSPGILGWLGIAVGAAWIAMIPAFYLVVAPPTWG